MLTDGDRVAEFLLTRIVSEARSMPNLGKMEPSGAHSMLVLTKFHQP